MAIQAILAEQAVSITELRKNPAKYILDEPVAILSKNKPAGYLLSAELFKRLLDAYEQQSGASFNAEFRPSAARLQAVTRMGADVILSTSEHDLGDFTE